MKKKARIFLIIVFVQLIDLCILSAQNTRAITDGAGRKIEIPSAPKRVACFIGTSYETLFLLGEADKVKYISSFQLSPWAKKLNPNLEHTPCLGSYSNPNIEDLVKEKIDVVFYWPWPRQVEQMQNAGITVVCPFILSRDINDIDEFINLNKNAILFYKDIMSTENKIRIDEYFKYYTDKISSILKITSDIGKDKRPKVYYSGGVSVFETHSIDSNTFWFIKIAGGDMVPAVKKSTHVVVTMEQIADLNPDIIMMGRLNSKDPVLKNSQWECTNAVKNKKLFICPEGVFYWDHSSEGILLLMYFAKSFHPDKFKDLDMVKELKFFYSKFYNYKLNDRECARILNHLPPEE